MKKFYHEILSAWSAVLIYRSFKGCRCFAGHKLKLKGATFIYVAPFMQKCNKCRTDKRLKWEWVDENTCRLEMMCLGLSNTVVSHRGTWSGCAKTKEESFLFLLPASFPLCYFVLALHPSPSSECRRECLLDWAAPWEKRVASERLSGLLLVLDW